MKRMCNIVATGNGGRPVSPFGQCGSINLYSRDHITTRLISSKNSRLRVRLLDRFKPR